MLWMGYTHLFVLSVTCMQLHAHDSRDILQVVEVRSRCLSIIGTESNCIEHGCMYIRTFLRTGHSKQNITLYVQSIHEYVHTYVCICLCCKLSAVYVRTRVGLCVWCSALVKSSCGLVVQPCRSSDQLSGPAAPDEEGQTEGLQPLPGADHETGVCVCPCVRAQTIVCA